MNAQVNTPTKTFAAGRGMPLPSPRMRISRQPSTLVNVIGYDVHAR